MERNSQRNTNGLECIFISDIYKADAENKGGAENNDAVLISNLRAQNFFVDEVYSAEVTPEFIKNNSDKKLIIGNFVLLTKAVKTALEGVDYLIYEHDHKYLITRDPSKYSNFIAPETDIVDRPFYENAKLVVCLSKIQEKCIRENLKIENVVNIGTSLWTDEKLAFIYDLSFKEKTKDICIVDSINPTKGTHAAINFCIKNKWEFDLISSSDERKFLNSLSSYKTLVFIPTVLESLCRLVVEAKMMNCKVYTKTHLLGAASEDWFSLSGEDLIEEIRKKQRVALKIFMEALL